MRTRTLAAAAIALGSLTVSSASAATPTEIVYTGPTLLQLGAASELSAFVRDAEGTRVGGPAGSAPSLTFQLGDARATATAAPNVSKIEVSLTPTQLGQGQALEIDFPGLQSYQATASVVRVDVWEHVLIDDTGAGKLLLNPTRNELRLLTGSYDSGTVTGVQMTSAGAVLALDVDTLDANGEQLLLKGSVVTDQGVFAIAGLAGEPFALAHA